MAEWLVVQTEHCRERWAAQNLARQNCLFYFPKVLEQGFIKVRGERTRLVRVKPLFPRYLFVQTITGQFHFLLTTPGVTAVVPGRLPGIEITKLQNRESDGVVVLPPRGKFEPGDSARIKQGAYAGHVGIVQGMSSHNRVHLLLDYLSRRTTFLVEEAKLEAA